VEYLGHIVSHEGVKVDPNKIKYMREWPIPKNLKKLKGLIGLEVYYHKFVNNYGQIVAPIITSLKKEEFSRTREETKDFEKLKEAMSANLVQYSSHNIHGKNSKATWSPQDYCK
jgi:hypothetical protein